MVTTKHDAVEWSDEYLEASDPQLAVADRAAAEQSQTVNAELPGETSLGLGTHVRGNAANSAVVWISVNHE